ncbi:MAG: UPF0164 family protein [Spirochaetia bacterium]
MKKWALFPVLFFLTIYMGFSEEFQDFYGNLNEFLARYGDPNTGLTVFPTLLIPIGGEYEGMATAYTAVSNSTGFIESNPSASSQLAYTELAFVHNNYIEETNFEGIIYTMRFNDLGIGFGGKYLYAAFTEYDNFAEPVNTGYYSETIATLNLSYNFFSGYYFYGLALGTNVKLAYRHIPEYFAAGQSAFAPILDFGMLTRFNLLKFYASRSRNFSIGVVLKNFGFLVLGEPLPTTATAGIAYSPIRPITLALDFNYPISFYSEYPAEQWNIASGLNIVFADFFSIHSGVQFRGASPRIVIGSTLTINQVNLTTNYTLDLLTQPQSPGDRFSIQASMNLGDRGRAAIQARIEELYLEGLELYANGQLIEAVQKLEEAVELDPSFGPAKATLRTVRRAIELQREMEESQQIERGAETEETDEEPA